ncbi:MAG TPA: YbjN domain-containing protein [Acidimicrobiales bacterium]|nr:YbjN domain-containing protein [Acidimicrobiales bacterium]
MSLAPDDGELLPPASEEELDRLAGLVDGWLSTQLETNPVLVALDRDETGERRWFVRLAGEDKEFTTVWLHLRQRALHAETYVMPAPEENERDFYEFFLRKNREVRGLWFAIGEEDAVFLVGQLPLEAITEGHLDRLIGSFWEYVERWFRTGLRIGFTSRFR